MVKCSLNSISIFFKETIKIFQNLGVGLDFVVNVPLIPTNHYAVPFKPQKL
jgi:hypothetical protein